MVAQAMQETKAVTEALELAEMLQTLEPSPIGEVVGETGTGKSAIARHLVRSQGALRVAAYEGMTRHQLLGAVAKAAGVEGPSTLWLQGLVELGESAEEADGRRPLLVVDEANKLRWQALELIRYLADEAGWAVLLVGTELYERQFQAARTRPMLLQLGRRIGAKRVRCGHLDRAEMMRFVLEPRFGEVPKKVATRFWQGTRRGNWGEAMELAAACQRLMQANGVGELTEATLEAALSWQANRREVG